MWRRKPARAVAAIPEPLHWQEVGKPAGRLYGGPDGARCPETSDDYRSSVDGPSGTPVPTDRAYWEKRANREMLQLIDQLLKIVNEVEPKAVLRYVKNVIGIQKDDHLPLYFVHFVPFKKWILLQIKLPQNEEADKQLDGTGLEVQAKGRDYRLGSAGRSTTSSERSYGT